MKDSIISVLAFPFHNELEVRITRGYRFNERPTRVHVYHANYRDRNKVKRLAELASNMNTLVLMKMIDYRVSVDALK